jgi:hypothetical protein
VYSPNAASARSACMLAELLIDCEEDRSLRAVLAGSASQADSSKGWVHREPAPHGEPAV